MVQPASTKMGRTRLMALARRRRLAAPRDHGEEQRHEDRRDEGRGEHAADDAGAHRAARPGAGAGGDHERQHAEHEGERGHHDRPEAQARRVERRLRGALALEEALLRELHDQDGVLRRQADQHDQADLEVDVVLEPAHGDESERPGDREGYRRHHGEGQQPPLVERGEDQEHHHDREREGDRRLAAGALLLEGLPRPGDGVALGQGARRHLFHGADRFARGNPRLAVAQHARGDEAVEALELLGADHVRGLDQRLERDHLAARRGAHVDRAQVLGLRAERRVGLHLHAVSAAELVEVVDVERGHGALQRLEDVLHRHAERKRLLAVDLDLELRHRRPEERVHAGELGVLAQLLDEALRHLEQAPRIRIAARLQVHLEAARGSQAADRRGVEGDHHPVAQLRAFLRYVACHGRGRDPGAANVPVLERDEERRGVGLVAAAQQVEADDAHHVLHAGALLRDLAHRGRELARALQGRAVGKLDVAEDVALVLGGHEARRNIQEQADAQREHRDEAEERQHRAREQKLDPVEKAPRGPGEAPVERPEHA
jgi:hypothetical protein